jgi:hydroxymethylpyrimidine/phosphomethylpyrimidine kinase
MLRKPKPEDLKLTNEINAVLDSMSIYGPDAPEYPALLSHLDKLKDLQRANRAAWKPSADQVLITTGTFASVVVIVAYEHMHVITTKAMSLIKFTR